MEQERLDREVEHEVATAMERSAGEKNDTDLPPNTRTHIQVSAAALCGASLLILTHVSTRPPCTHSFVKQAFFFFFLFARVPLISRNR